MIICETNSPDLLPSQSLTEDHQLITSFSQIFNASYSILVPCIAVLFDGSSIFRYDLDLKGIKDEGTTQNVVLTKAFQAAVISLNQLRHVHGREQEL